MNFTLSLSKDGMVVDSGNPEFGGLVYGQTRQEAMLKDSSCHCGSLAEQLEHNEATLILVHVTFNAA